VISIDGRLCRGGGGGERIVEQGSDIVVQRALVALEREAIIATLIDDLLSDRALTVLKWTLFLGLLAKLGIGCSVRKTERAMAKKTRRKIDTALKAKIALEAVREQEIMQRGIAGSRVIQPLPTGGKLIQDIHPLCGDPLS